MNQSHPVGATTGSTGRDEEMSALFAQLVMQQANMALMLMGKAAHPETGQVVRDLEAAKLFIDQIEMLQAKTKGNLTRQEAALLQQSLMTLRLDFVQAVDSPASPPAGETPAQTTGSVGASTPAEAAGAPPSSPPDLQENPKKFTKKY